MDRLGGIFGSHNADEYDDFDLDEDADDGNGGTPPSPVGQDERRMQVRAYNHWAGLLNDRNFPAIGDLNPAGLDDFGPYSVLLDFSSGVENPQILFLGRELAGECDAHGRIARLSDVPSRSLLSRITDHYMQILANQAPIGFEAEFVNQRGHTAMYRGILLPYSSNDETIDFIYGVINWKELADRETADELLLEIDQVLERDADRDAMPPESTSEDDEVLDLAGAWVEEEDVLDLADTDRADVGPAGPAVETALSDDGEIDWDAADSPLCRRGGSQDDSLGDDEGEEDEPDYSVDYGEYGLEDESDDDDVDDVIDPLADDSVGSGLAALVSRGHKRKPLVELPSAHHAVGMEDVSDGTCEEAPRIPQAYEPEEPAAPASFVPAPLTVPVPAAAIDDDGFDAPAEPSPGPTIREFTGHSFSVEREDEPSPEFLPELDSEFEPEPEPQPHPVGDSEPGVEIGVEIAFADEAPPAADPQPPVVEPSLVADQPQPDEPEDVVEGLYDTLAAARELAQVARSNEDRTRTALYRAVGRAYDFSIEASVNPDDFAELVADNGLSVQDRAPMTPVVKLVFGADYDKTRLTEYAAVLSHAHRLGVERGTLADLLKGAEGGLKGIVEAERRARKKDTGKPVERADRIPSALAKKLRGMEPIDFDDLDEEGPEFALVMVRRTPTGELVVLGEVPQDRKLVERAGRKLVA